ELYLSETNQLINGDECFQLFERESWDDEQYTGRKRLSGRFHNRFIELDFNYLLEYELEIIIEKKKYQLPKTY
ncbi:unnamed protein product, partial [Rotaria sordida]